MKVILPRYVHGMLITPDKSHVFGNLRPVAYSTGFPVQLQREVYEKVRPGIDREILKEVGISYGFFSLSENDYVVARFELMDLTEPTSRGKLVFSEYVYLTESQLKDQKWNLLPIFRSFSKKIDYYDQVVTDLAPAEVDIDQDKEWFENLRTFQVQVEAVLSRYLSSPQNINIISAPNELEPETRLKFICAFVQCIPEYYRKNISFATLANNTSENVKIFFSNRKSGYGQIVDWLEPKMPILSGAIYANWIAGLIIKGNAEDMKEKISELKIPIANKSEHLRTYGDQLDLAIEKYEFDVTNKKNRLRITVPEQLELLLNQIKKYTCLYSDQEVADWLSVMLTFVMKLNAYDIGVDALSSYLSLLTEKEIRQQLVYAIVSVTFKQRKEDRLDALADFITRVTQYSIKTKQGALIEFCQQILLSALSSKQYRKGLKLWAKVGHLIWANERTWFKTALDAIRSIDSKDDFIFVVDTLGCPLHEETFPSLFAILQRSPSVLNQLQANVTFLDISKHYRDKEYLDLISKCYFEVASHKWLSRQIEFVLNNYPDIKLHLPGLVNQIGKIESEKLLNYVASRNDSMLTALITFSLILNGIYSAPAIKSQKFNEYIALSNSCKSSDIESAVEILSNYWNYFSLNQLKLILDLLERKTKNHQNIQKVKDVLRNKNRIQNVKDTFAQKIDNEILKQKLFDLISEFVHSADTDAWLLFVEQIQESGLSVDEYRGNLTKRLLQSRFFQLKPNQLIELVSSLEQKGLFYEADVFTYQLVFMGNLSADLIQTMIRTLDSTSYSVKSRDAAIIIGLDRGLDKKYMGLLAEQLVNKSPLESRDLIGRIDKFISRQSTKSSQIKLKALFRDPDPSEIWIEFCTILSYQIKMELQRKYKRRK